VVLLSSGAWLGGTLVTRNQIGIDHRYAKAGKWREERVTPNAEGVVVSANSEPLEVNQMKLLHVNGRRIVLGRTEEGYVAFDDSCTHRGGSLADGVMICGRVQCPWHGSQFDALTGVVHSGPAKEPITAYRVEQHGPRVDIHLTK
jgi:nitrite reductase/ring-hydroxylating ferredoxin subunit